MGKGHLDLIKLYNRMCRYGSRCPAMPTCAAGQYTDGTTDCSAGSPFYCTANVVCKSCDESIPHTTSDDAGDACVGPAIPVCTIVSKYHMPCVWGKRCSCS